MLAYYDYRIMHYSGEHNCWADLLSRWIKVPAVAVRAVVVFASSSPDETTPSKDAIREVQQQARASLSAMLNGAAFGTCSKQLPQWLPEALGNISTSCLSFGCDKATALATRSSALIHAATCSHFHASLVIARFDATCLVRR